MADLPKPINVQYVGLLGTDDGRHKQRIVDDDVLSSLDWNVQADLVIFTFWISTTKTKESVAKCLIEDTDIFVNVSFVDQNRAVDVKLAELGGRSVKDVLLLLETKMSQSNP